MSKNKHEIAPDEIRAIRKRLDLSQVEAGEVIGGGPRAFTKYEAGTTKPAASLVNLLRLLDANPSAIASLQGRASRSVVAGEVSPFDVTAANISVLTPTLLPQLLRRLLHAEAQTWGIPRDGIHVASNISAADGGEDGRIEWNGGPDRTPFLPSRRNLFQSKAGKTRPATLAKEVLTRDGAVKERVRSVLDAGGNYIMLCGQPLTGERIEDLKTRICENLSSAGLTVDADQVDVRDSDQIAVWVNDHAAVAIWVKECTQPGTAGPFRSWSAWADRSEHDGSDWVEDERLVLLRNRLRELGTEPRTVLRIVGLYGVGKSRLALEALGPSRGLGIYDFVMYAVQSEIGASDILSVVQNLADAGTCAVVVVDDCDTETHQILAAFTRRQRSRLSLVTIDNEVPSGTLDQDTLKIDESHPSVTESILDRALSGLQHGDRSRLERFSVGFPEVAVRLARTWNESIPVSHATNDELVDAHVFGRIRRGGETLKKCAELLAVFGLVGLESPADGQLSAVAGLGRSVSGDDVYSAVVELLGRGVARRRGSLVSLQPLPIAMRLAERQWKAWRPAIWETVLCGETPTKLKVTAAKQLALLNTTDIAQRATEHVCRPGGSFEGLEGISQNGHAEVLSALSEIDPEVVVEQIERSLSEVEDLSTVTGEVQRHLVWALEKIAFHRRAFEEAAHLLLRLAAADELQSRSSASRDFGRFNQVGKATGTFGGLFSMHLGGTEADGDTRRMFLDEVAASDDPIEREIVAQALASGLQTRYSWRMAGPEAQGSRPALTPWQPATREDAHKYIDGCATLLAQLALKEDEPGLSARSLLGDELFRLVQAGFIDTVATVVRQVGHAVDYWPEALTSLRKVNSVHAKDLDPEVSKRVKELATELQPKSLEARIRSLVTEVSWDGPEGSEPDSDSRYQLRVDAVRGLAEELAKQPSVLMQCLPQLSRGPHAMSEKLGTAIAELAPSPLEWFDPIVQAVKAAPEKERNHGLLTGFATGLVSDHIEALNAFKREAARSAELAPALPWVCWRLGITSADIQLAIDSLQDGPLEPSWLSAWAFGRQLAAVSPQHLAPLFDTLLDHSAEGFAVAVHLMGRFSYRDRDRLEALRPQIRKLAENSSRWKVPRRHGESQHYFQLVVGWMLGKGRQDTDAWATALALAQAVVNAEGIDHDLLLEPVLPQILSDFPEVSWPIIGQAIVSDSRRAWRLGFILGDTYSPPDTAKPTLLKLPDASLFAWCHAHPNRAPAFVAQCVPVLNSGEDALTEPSLHPIIVRLLDEFGDRDDVRQGVETNIHNFGGSGSATTYYARYKQPLSELLRHRRPKVRRWAGTMLRRLDRQIDAVRKQDEEFEAQWA